MSNLVYENVLERLRKERGRLSITKADMSRYLHMDQSNYRKAELGQYRRFSYFEVKSMSELGINVNYIYTGKVKKVITLDFIEKLSVNRLKSILQIIYTIVELSYKEDFNQQYKALLEELKYIFFIKQNVNPSDIFLTVRRLKGYTQIKMADMIGVDVKKLRNLENGKKLPDSEIISKMYEVFKILPVVMIETKNCMLDTILYILDEIKKEDREKIVDIIKLLFA
jgi:transcriptional regulator with XRE-family HTH domain